MDNYTKEYVQKLIEKYKSGHAREHAYRPALDEYFEKISGYNVVNDPKRSEYGSPDFVFLKGKTIIAYAEAKDIDASLDETSKSSQLERYYGYSNLILTNYIEFRFYRNGQVYCPSIKIAEIKGDAIIPIEANFELVADSIKQFVDQAKEPIKSGTVLAKVMAWKGRRIRDTIRNGLNTGDEKKNESLLSIFNIIKTLLLAELDYEKFADMYAQTLVYGLFVARYYDNTSETFSRQEARDLVPASNPFLKHFFDHIAGSSFDSRIEMIVTELCDEFTYADVQAISHNYYKTEKDQTRDPIIHFYEDFLKEYNPKERLEMGVFYTPVPVVQFIVKSIDEILKKEFDLNGLADSLKVEIQREIQGKKVKQQVHKVQILDPATGTGTFLDEIIPHIKKSFEGQEGRWPKYLQQELLPRLHGFELMMAPYTIAHLKLSTRIKETGGDIGDSRIGIYLTNSLDQAQEEPKTLFDIGLVKAITEESVNANYVKKELPIMVVLGNPPYSGESSNPDYHEHNVYKIEPGTQIKLQEKNSKWINDDYVKFIRLAESMVEKTGEGIIGMITAHGYIDNPTFRGMRYHLMQTFDSIYILDLHGNSNKKETTADGKPDENVFDIKTGVSIILGIKKKTRENKLAQIHKYDILGTREMKFDFLNTNSESTVGWERIKPTAPNYKFIKTNEVLEKEYLQGFSVKDLFPTSSVGVVTGRDALSIQNTKEEIKKVIADFINFDTEILREKYQLGKDTLDWKVEMTKKDVIENNHDNSFIQISYRPFDNRWTFYTETSQGFIYRPRDKVMKHMFNKINLSLITGRTDKNPFYSSVFCSKYITEAKLGESSTQSYIFPLYLYSKNGTKTPNFNSEIYSKIIANFKEKVEPENILDYIYAVLYSPDYRNKYKEFLKSDFPRVPYPSTEKHFFDLAKYGEQLRKLHLMESTDLKIKTTFSEAGSDIVEKISYRDNKVYINQTQYFGNVSEIAWNFYIGGYQPAQKWLKDRKGKELSNQDIEHYQKIVTIVDETDQIMKEIDNLN